MTRKGVIYSHKVRNSERFAAVENTTGSTHPGSRGPNSQADANVGRLRGLGSLGDETSGLGGQR